MHAVLLFRVKMEFIAGQIRKTGWLLPAASEITG